MVVEQALDHLLTNNFFDITTMQKIMEVIGADRDTDAYKLLTSLHCVHYSKMRPELRDSIPQLINEALRPRGIAREVVDAVLDGVPL
jgi:hypothetical protein